MYWLKFDFMYNPLDCNLYEISEYGLATLKLADVT
jgi:hypothetical protein